MFTFTLTPDDGESFEVKADSRDVYMWERTGKGRTLRALLEDLAIGELYAVAWQAVRRQQHARVQADTFEAFTAAYALDFEEDAAADPSRPGASDAS